MEKIYKGNRTISYLLYLGLLFLLGWLVGDYVNINGLQEVLNALINLDAEKGLKCIFFTMICIAIEIGMFLIYSLIYK